ncbi:MAG: hypothetical protein IIB56_15190 [Planctomycetes bacterium]|nr:hypothetical protein [Planctomycetota bacterium]
MREEEVRALLWSCLYFFCVLSAYYIIRPIRDDMGVAGGVRNLPWLFTGTLIAMVAVMMFLSASPALADFCIDEGGANVENVGPSPSEFGDDDGVAKRHGAAWRAHQNSDAIDNGCST